MGYEYFNTSYLAFGSKITKAFRSLGGLLDGANKNIESLENQLNFLDAYMNKNYKVPFPAGEDDATQCAQLYQVLGNQPIQGLNIEIATTDGVADGIAIDAIVFNKAKSKLTKLSGVTHKMLKGAVYLTLSGLNNIFTGTVHFVEDESNLADSKSLMYDIFTNEIKLFNFEVIPDENIVIISKPNLNLPVTIGSYNRKYSNIIITNVTDQYKGNKTIPNRKFLWIRNNYTSGNFDIWVRYNGDSSSQRMYGYWPSNGGKAYILGTPWYLNKGDYIEPNNIESIWEIKYV